MKLINIGDIPRAFKNIDNRPVIFESHSLIGAGCIILLLGKGLPLVHFHLLLKIWILGEFTLAHL